MSTHITPPPRAEQAEPEAVEPARRASRFDERGIALQTIIIMVVLLAIAGAVAAVIASRAGEETGRLEETDTAAYGITNQTGCELGGHEWDTTVTQAGSIDDATHGPGLKRAGLVLADITKNEGFCKPKT